MFVTASTGLVTVHAISAGQEQVPELTEVPLMTLMFMAMVYHVIRRQQATAIAQKLAVERQRLLDREHAFFSDASHELMTPLTIARGHIELLEPDVPAPDPPSPRHGTSCFRRARAGWSASSTACSSSSGRSAPSFSGYAPTPAAQFVTEIFRRWPATADRRWVLERRRAGHCRRSMPISSPWRWT